MLKSLRHLFGREPASAELAVFSAWSEARGFELRRVRGVPGCVAEGRFAGLAGRVEWGASQRSYIEGMELRLVADVELPRDLLAVVLNRPLMLAMERMSYEQLIHDVQTRMDTDLPSEMRWLVMHVRAGQQELGRLRERYGAATNLMPWLSQWLASPLNDALAATLDTTPAQQPVVLTCRGGRLLLRTAMPQPDALSLTQWASVFEHAVRDGVRLGASWREAAGTGPQTQPLAWPLSDPATAAPGGAA